jgi:hypothetical protein
MLFAGFPCECAAGGASDIRIAATIKVLSFISFAAPALLRWREDR